MIDTVVNFLKNKTQSNCDDFFRTLTVYSICKVASVMQAKIHLIDRGEIPINCYAINLGPSGIGKTYSTSLIADHVTNQFDKNFKEHTLRQVTERNLSILASQQASDNGSSVELELENIKTTLSKLGEFPHSFKDGTAPAIQEVRQQILIRGIGSINLEIDEMGSKLVNVQEFLSTFLELYDVGKMKQKIIKNHKDQVRLREIDDQTPTNLNMFGTQDKVWDGGAIESTFDTGLTEGFARRCIFGITTDTHNNTDLTGDQLYDIMLEQQKSNDIELISNKLGALADISQYRRVIQLEREVYVKLLNYRRSCELLSNEMMPHETTKKAEMDHRYFKALKIAGALSFYNSEELMSHESLDEAIECTEKSGEAFLKIINRDPSHAKLAKFLSNTDSPTSQVELMDNLPFYNGTATARKEMLRLAVVWGYTNNIIIKQTIIDGIDFIEGESLKKTDLDKLYLLETVDNKKRATVKSFSELGSYIESIDDFTYVFRTVDSTLNSNFISFSFDSVEDMQELSILLDEYCHICSVDDSLSKISIFMPTNYCICAQEDRYNQIINNIYDWMPVNINSNIKTEHNVDLNSTITKEGAVFDILPYIPNTNRNNDRLSYNKKKYSHLIMYLMYEYRDKGHRTVVEKAASFMSKSGKYGEDEAIGILTNIPSLDVSIMEITETVKGKYER